MKKKILGGRSNACEFCRGTIIYLDVKGVGKISQCKECGSISQGKTREIKIYTYEGDE